MSILKERYLEIMTDFFDKYNLHPEGQGGAFAGPSIQTILKEELLSELMNILNPEVAEPVVNYLRNIRELYALCVAKNLTEDYDMVIQKYKESFLVLYHNDKIKLPMTVKVHVIVHHLADYFRMTGMTLRSTSAAYCETTHQKLRLTAITHKYVTSKNLGSAIHLYKLKKLSCLYNYRCLGFTNILWPSNKKPEKVSNPVELDHNYWKPQAI